jgi:hypothetical protein
MLPRWFSFCADLVRLNRPRLDDFNRFLMHPGMLFGASMKWWGKEGPRRFPHEGVDFHFYLNRYGETCRLEPGILLPVPVPGRVAGITEDFLGRSIFAVTPDERSGKTFLWIYGHVEPFMQPGSEIKSGQIPAVIARPRNPAVPPHLHLSMAWLPADFPLDQLDWPNLHATPGVTFFDPLPLLACP